MAEAETMTTAPRRAQGNQHFFAKICPAGFRTRDLLVFVYVSRYSSAVPKGDGSVSEFFLNYRISATFFLS
jgi:hypothetical protein